jgi:hypothetical protein
MEKAQSGKLSLSEFIESLVGLLMPLMQHIANSDLQAMRTILPDLCSFSAELKEVEVNLRNVESRLQETSNRVQNSCEALRTGTLYKFLFCLSDVLYI